MACESAQTAQPSPDVSDSVEIEGHVKTDCSFVTQGARRSLRGAHHRRPRPPRAASPSPVASPPYAQHSSCAAPLAALPEAGGTADAGRFPPFRRPPCVPRVLGAVAGAALLRAARAAARSRMPCAAAPAHNPYARSSQPGSLAQLRHHHLAALETGCQ